MGNHLYDRVYTSRGGEYNLNIQLGGTDIEEIIVTGQAVNFDTLGVGPRSTFTSEDLATLPSIDRDMAKILRD